MASGKSRSAKISSSGRALSGTSGKSGATSGTTRSSRTTNSSVGSALSQRGRGKVNWDIVRDVVTDRPIDKDGNVR